MYYHWDHGPVAIKSLTVINELICDDDVAGEQGESDKDVLGKYLKLSKYRIPPVRRKYPIFELKQNPDTDCLSESEIESVNEVVKQYGHLSPMQLRHETHKDVTWSETRRNDEIDYRLFFKDEPDADKEALEYMESVQENFDLISSLE